MVLDDADLDAAVDATAFGAFANQGQICMSTERMIVDRSDRRSTGREARAKARKLVATSAIPDDGVVLGSVVERSTVERVAALVEDAAQPGRDAVWPAARRTAR